MRGLSAGPVHDMASGEICALPARACRIHVQIQTATSIELSNESDMSEDQSFAAADFQTAGAYEGGLDVAAGFISCVGGTARVRLAAY